MNLHNLSIPCATPQLATEFADYLRGEEIDVTNVVDRIVHIPFGGDPVFAFGIADLAVFGEYANDDEVVHAVSAAVPGA